MSIGLVCKYIEGGESPEITLSLAETLGKELEKQECDSRRWNLVNRGKLVSRKEPFDRNLAGTINHEIIETLDEMSPDFCYFGLRPGTDDEYGFWVDHAELDLAVKEGEVKRANTLEETKDNFYSYFIDNDSVGHLFKEAKEIFTVYPSEDLTYWIEKIEFEVLYQTGVSLENTSYSQWWLISKYDEGYSHSEISSYVVKKIEEGEEGVS